MAPPPSGPSTAQLETCNCCSQVGQLRATLLLLAQCRAASGGRRPWSAAADARLKALPAELNATAMRSGAAPAAVASSAATAAAEQHSTAAVPRPAGTESSAAIDFAASDTADSRTAATFVHAAPVDEAGVEGPTAPGGKRRGAARQPAAEPALAATRRACRACIALLKELDSGQQGASKRD